MPSSTVVNGRLGLRPCFINGRTTPEHVEGFIDDMLRIGAELARQAT